jgi:zinc transport system permease protein|tara:strand:- start:542 stop:1351 length:810 start_codon:yes stop_codon:yes gene_type:complete
MDIIDMFSISFMQRAFIGSFLLSITYGLYGMFIIPRKIGFMADGISHASLLGIAVGLSIGINPLLPALLLAAFLGFLLAYSADSSNVTSDGLIGIFLSGGMSGAIIIMAFMPGYKPDLFSYLFGNLLSIQNVDIYALVAFTIFSIIGFILQWRALVISTIHLDLSKVINLPTTQSKYFLFIGMSIGLILGVKLLGVILISALLITPVMTANQIATSFKGTFITTQLIGFFATFTGIILSYSLDLPPGPTIALLLVAIFVFSLLQSKLSS